jgi:hypothetical protein
LKFQANVRECATANEKPFGLLALISIVIFAATTSFAHITSISYSEVVIEDNQARMLLRAPLPELDLALDLDRNHDATVDELELQEEAGRIQTYLKERIEFIVENKPLPAGIGDLTIWRDSDGHPFLETSIIFTSVQDRTLKRFKLRCDLLREIVQDHRTIAKITANDRTEEFIFENGRSYEGEREGIIVSLVQFVRLGIIHIFTGYDHIAFLLGLLLMGGSFKNVLKIITSFTIAHSLTLGLAALNAIIIPSWIIESGIALSIVYIAAENLFFHSFDHRWIVTSFFGLVHGFGFANILKEMDLSRSELIAMLFPFNFGVEIGQVVILSLLLPLLWLAKGRRYYDLLVKSASVLILCWGLVLLYERGFVG